MELGARNIDAIDMPEYGIRQNFNKDKNNILNWQKI